MIQQLPMASDESYTVSFFLLIINFGLRHKVVPIHIEFFWLHNVSHFVMRFRYVSAAVVTREEPATRMPQHY